MKSVEELGRFYEQVLLPSLRQLDAQRVSVLKRSIAVIAVVLAVSGGLLLVHPMAGAFGILLGGGIGAAVINGLVAPYRAAFKNSIILTIVKFIDPGLTYIPDDRVPEALYLSSLIFQRYPDRYRGEDLVRGKIGETEIVFSELHTEYKTEHTDSKGRRHTSWHTIFKGLFIVSDFNKRFHGSTVVLPDTAERIFGPLGQFFQSLTPGRGQLVKLDDPEFEKCFAVWSDDQVEARYILSTSLMARLTAFRKKVGHEIYVSFTDSKMFLAISRNENLLEPPLHCSLVDFSSVLKYYQDIEAAVSVVEELNLNTRIWGA